MGDLGVIWSLKKKKMGVESDIRKLEIRKNKIESISKKTDDMDDYKQSIDNLIDQCKSSLDSAIDGLAEVEGINEKINRLKEAKPLSSKNNIVDASTNMSNEIKRINNEISDCKSLISSYEDKIREEKAKDTD